MKKILLAGVMAMFAMTSFAQKNGDFVSMERGEGYPQVTASTKIVYVNKKPNTVGRSLIMPKQDFHGGVASFQDPATKLWGTIDVSGNVLIKPSIELEFGAPLPFYYGGRSYIKAPRGEKGYHIIDESGRVLVKLPNIANVTEVVNGYVACLYYGDFYKGSKYGYLDMEGKPVFVAASKTVKNAKIPQIFAFVNGLFPFEDQSTHLWGYFDEFGQIAIAPQFKKATEFSGGLAAVLKDNKWGFIDISGKVAVDFQYATEPSKFSYGYSVVMRDSDRKKCFIDREGNVKFTAVDAKGFNEEGIAIIKTAGKIYMVNTSFKIQKNLGTMPMMNSMKKTDQFEVYNNFWVLRPNGWTRTYVTDKSLNAKFWAYSLNSFSDGLSFTYFDDPDDTQHRRSGYVNSDGDVVILFQYLE